MKGVTIENLNSMKVIFKNSELKMKVSHNVCINTDDLNWKKILVQKFSMLAWKENWSENIVIAFGCPSNQYIMLVIEQENENNNCISCMMFNTPSNPFQSEQEIVGLFYRYFPWIPIHALKKDPEASSLHQLWKEGQKTNKCNKEKFLIFENQDNDRFYQQMKLRTLAWINKWPLEQDSITINWNPDQRMIDIVTKSQKVLATVTYQENHPISDQAIFCQFFCFISSSVTFVGPKVFPYHYSSDHLYDLALSGIDFDANLYWHDEIHDLDVMDLDFVENMQSFPLITDDGVE
jgi:hypothetical protein